MIFQEQSTKNNKTEEIHNGSRVLKNFEQTNLFVEGFSRSLSQLEEGSAFMTRKRQQRAQKRIVYGNNEANDAKTHRTFKSSEIQTFQGNSLRRFFSLKEDLILAKYFKKDGSKWGEIALYLPGRSASKVKNRYYSYIKDEKVFNALIYILHGWETTDEIENIPETILFPFRKFIPHGDI